jgi:DNA (cytosine-5)-methyltransferase 1
MKVLDLFSGIGGFSLGLERAGMETVAFCEIDKKCRMVLKKHWPDIPIYEDVKEITIDKLKNNGIEPDVICGGFPCQDISSAGKQEGITGDQSGLWSEFFRIISEVRPHFAVIENVRNLLSGQRGTWFSRILGDLAEIGYDVEWHCISAAIIGAPHLRERVWILAYPKGERCGKTRKYSKQSKKRVTGGGKISDSNVIDGFCRGFRASKIPIIKKADIQQSEFWSIEPAVGRVANGFPGRVDRLKQLGNSVVPQIPELIGRAILESNQN